MVKASKNDVNTYDDPIDTVPSGLIFVSTFATLKLESRDDTPSEDILPQAKGLQAQPNK